MASETAEILDPVERLALAYASASARPAWEALLLFQHRLAETAKRGREPLMIQIRLAWWRDRLAETADEWPHSEPLLARLHIWKPETGALIGLIDGWEADIVGEDDGAALAQARIEAFAALGRLVGEGDPAAVRLAAEQLVRPEHITRPTPRLSRKMRPLSLLRAHALRSLRDGGTTPLADFAVLMRIGLLGR